MKTSSNSTSSKSNYDVTVWENKSVVRKSEFVDLESARRFAKRQTVGCAVIDSSAAAQGLRGQFIDREYYGDQKHLMR